MNAEAEWDDLMASLGLKPSTPARISPEERAANTARCREQRRRRAARGLPPDDPRHGDPNTYTNWGCRCPRCRAANTDAVRPRMQAHRARLKEAA